MQDNFAKIGKAAIISIIVALLFSLIVVVAIKVAVGDKIKLAMSLINSMSMQATETKQEEIVMSTEKNRLETYPAFGTKYGTIEIDSINLKLPVYRGDTNEILRVGVGQFDGSYFPGEGGSIIYAAHNTAKFFRNLPTVKVGDKIKITTDYGEFNYKVYDTQVIHMSEEEKLPIQDEEEILMVYTCYPVTGVGHKTHRFVVYAELLEEE